MTQFHDSGRRRIGERPCWLSQARVLPALQFTPVEGGLGEYEVELVINGSWASGKIWTHDVQRFLTAWQHSPEEAIETWFGLQPPTDDSDPDLVRLSTRDILVEVGDADGETQVVVLDGAELDL